MVSCVELLALNWFRSHSVASGQYTIMPKEDMLKSIETAGLAHNVAESENLVQTLVQRGWLDLSDVYPTPSYGVGPREPVPMQMQWKLVKEGFEVLDNNTAHLVLCAAYRLSQGGDKEADLVGISGRLGLPIEVCRSAARSLQKQGYVSVLFNDRVVLEDNGIDRVMLPETSAKQTPAGQSVIIGQIRNSQLQIAGDKSEQHMQSRSETHDSSTKKTRVASPWLLSVLELVAAFGFGLVALSSTGYLGEDVRSWIFLLGIIILVFGGLGSIAIWMVRRRG